MVDESHSDYRAYKVGHIEFKQSFKQPAKEGFFDLQFAPIAKKRNKLYSGDPIV